MIAIIIKNQHLTYRGKIITVFLSDHLTQGGKKDEKKKKKKGEPELKLRRTAPQLKLLATFHIPLDEFLEGEFEFEKTFIHGSAETASTIASRDSPDPGGKKVTGWEVFHLMTLILVSYMMSEKVTGREAFHLMTLILVTVI